jgi:hypothetical protein
MRDDENDMNRRAGSDADQRMEKHVEPRMDPRIGPQASSRAGPRNKPNRAAALLLAVFTAWPLLFIGLFFVYIVLAMFSIGMGRAGHGLPWAGVVMPILFLTLLEGFALLVVYFTHLLLFNHALDTEKKIAWGVAMLIGSAFAMAAYWYLFLWRDARDPAGGARRLQAL